MSPPQFNIEVTEAMQIIDQRPFGSSQERQNEKALESQYRDIGNRDIRAAVEIRRPENRAPGKDSPAKG